MTLESLLALAATVFIFSLKPGPGILTSMSYSLSHGFSGLVAFLSGFNIGLCIFLVIVFLGFMGVNHFDIDFVFLAILAKSFAAIYLLVIGGKELQAWSVDAGLDVPKIDKSDRLVDILFSAVILTLSNPMVIVFYASIVPAFVSPESITLDVAILIIGMMMIIDSLGTAIYCVPLIMFKKSLPETFSKHIRFVSGVIIILIGLYIGYTALPAQDILAVF